VGPQSSGKTVLLAQLYVRFPVSNRWKILPTPETQPHIDAMRTTHVEQRNFPLGTREEEKISIAYEFERRDTGERLRLFTEDRAGVLSERLGAQDLEHFTQASAMAMMIDATRPHFSSEVQRALENFYLAGKDKRPTAFCLSKADLYIHSTKDYERVMADGAAFVQERLPENLVRRIGDFCPTRRFFPVSSVGVHIRYGTVQPTIYYDQRMFLRMKDGITPIHLLEPFEWLFEALSVDG
jgi:hypothetical protein